MTLYGGIDLHSTNSYVVLIYESGSIHYKKRLPNDISTILLKFKQFKQINSLVVESTYNWYLLVDGLKEASFDVKLANPTSATYPHPYVTFFCFDVITFLKICIGLLNHTD